MIKMRTKIGGQIKMLKGWIGQPSPKSKRVGTGWFGDLDRVYVDTNRTYCVMIRTITVEGWGKVEHAAIRNIEGVDIPWAEKQRIKNEIFGEDRAAFEVYPKVQDLVDEANMYHLWVLSKDVNLPVNLKNAH